MTHFIEQTQLAAGLAFAITSDPPCPVETVDDWYDWVVSADAVDQLNVVAAKIRLAEEILCPSGTDADPHGLLHLIRLGWDSERWLKEQDTITALKIKDAFPVLHTQSEYEAARCQTVIAPPA